MRQSQMIGLGTWGRMQPIDVSLSSMSSGEDIKNNKNPVIWQIPALQNLQINTVIRTKGGQRLLFTGNYFFNRQKLGLEIQNLIQVLRAITILNFKSLYILVGKKITLLLPSAQKLDIEIRSPLCHHQTDASQLGHSSDFHNHLDANILKTV